jgi:hypothetical protein
MIESELVVSTTNVDLMSAESSLGGQRLDGPIIN